MLNSLLGSDDATRKTLGECWPLSIELSVFFLCCPLTSCKTSTAFIVEKLGTSISVVVSLISGVQVINTPFFNVTLTCSTCFCIVWLFWRLQRATAPNAEDLGRKLTSECWLWTPVSKWSVWFVQMEGRGGEVSFAKIAHQLRKK